MSEPLLIKKLSENATLPKRATDKSIGLDLYSCETTCIPAGNRALVRTGVAVKTPQGTYGRIAPRSGLALKFGIDVGAGVIDPDYTGEVGVLLFNFGTCDYSIAHGERIAQLILEKALITSVEVVENLAETNRGDRGFGSSGK